MVHVVLGLCLAAEDEELQEAIRRELKKAIGSRAGEPQLGRARTPWDRGPWVTTAEAFSRSAMPTS
jgi:hypothetical protein